MTKTAFISLAVLVLNDKAAAFGVKSSRRVDVARTSSCLAYKKGQDDENIAGSSDAWTKGSFSQEPSASLVNGTDQVVIYSDFPFIREDDRPPKETSTKAAEQLPAAKEPSSSKPVKKFITPIQMMKLVPKVEPIANSSVFFVAPVVDYETDKKSSQAPPSTAKNNGMKAKWSPRKKWGTSAFSTTTYLESLSPANNDVQQDNDTKSLMASLRNQQAQIRAQREESTLQAMRDATRRTSPHEAIKKRMAKAEELRKQKEVERLEKLYVERKERLESKMAREREAKESREWYREEKKRMEDALSEKRDRSDEAGLVDVKSSIRRGIPILGPFLKSPLSSPLLIGSTVSLQHDNLTPFQLKTLEVAQSLHSEHCSKMEVEALACSAGEEGGIEAAPIVAVIDNYSGSFDSSLKGKNGRRFATLAAVEFVKSKSGEPISVTLMGVGRAFLHSYFSSRDAGLTKEEEDLAKLLQMMQDRNVAEDDMVESNHDDEHEDVDFPIIMAEFDLLLDDSSLSRSSMNQDMTKQRASSMHAVTELYRCANKVYRLHEERKKLLSGLRTGQARLDLREGKGHEVIEYDDWSGVEAYTARDDTNEEEVQFNDYGFGTYGIFSTIPDLTKELMSLLESYYSPAHRGREEYEAEVASFVALRTLEKYADPLELAAAMVVPSATERLDLAYDIMLRHQEDLLLLVEKMSNDLRVCGDEHTDLW